MLNQVVSTSLTRPEAIETLRDLKGDPFFLFLHYLDPHYEYRDHPDFDYADAYNGWLKETRPSIEGLRDARQRLDDADLGYLTDLYDEEIAHTDQQLGRLFAFLNDSGLADTTAVILVSDHGEEFMERGWLGHTISLHDELTRVPLVLVLPGIDSVTPVVSRTVETRAIFATVLDYLDVSREHFEAADSLLSAVRGSATHGITNATVGVAFSEVWLPNQDLGKRVQASSLRTDGWKLIRNTGSKSSSLYDLTRDASERHNVITEQPKESGELGELLESWMREMEGNKAAPRRGPDAETMDRLRSLGYVR